VAVGAELDRLRESEKNARIVFEQERGEARQRHVETEQKVKSY
jgi:hypothetical protein